MMKLFLSTLCLYVAVLAVPQSPVYVCRNIQARLYSEAPLENIEATSAKGFSVLNASNGEIQVTVPIRSFQFRKSLMQEHFNENYLESDQFPNAAFKGKINEPVRFDKDGEYLVTVTGDLEVHGVKQPRTIGGTLKVTNGSVTISSVFNVRCADHKIKIPTLVFKNIAESIQITISGNYSPYSKP